MQTEKIISLVAALAREALKKDSDHRYALMEEYTFYLKFTTPVYSDDLWTFAPISAASKLTKVSLKIYDLSADGKPVNDGATYAPDAPAKAMAGLHDPGYLRAAAIAAAWEGLPCAPYGGVWDEGKVRRMWDDIGGDAMRDVDKAPGWLTRAYYSACRYFGGVYRAIKRARMLLALALALLALAGCAGCLNPPDVADFPAGMPALEKIDNNNEAESAKQ